jgi:protein kinase
MHRYQVLNSVGDGAFGVVTKCVDRETGQQVAIKRMKERSRSWEECLELKEVKSLRKISKVNHENIVELKAVFRENDYLYLVFELCGPSLLTVIKGHPDGLPEPFIRNVLVQLLRGLVVVHQQGFFHRDIKPENLLFCGDTLKILDFGLAREIRSRPPYTQYTGTRWYRAPEVLFRHQFYNSPVDLWAVGAIAAELYTNRPLFQGASEVDQIYRICGVIGPPTPSTWPEGMKLAAKMGLRLSQTSGSKLAGLLPNASPAAIDFISGLLTMDPNRRLSAKNALAHPFLQGEQMTLSALDHRVEKRASRRPTLGIGLPPPEPTLPPEERPRAAPITPSPRTTLRRSWSQERLEQITRPLKQVDISRPVDYRIFEASGQSDDDLFDDI